MTRKHFLWASPVLLLAVLWIASPQYSVRFRTLSLHEDNAGLMITPFQVRSAPSNGWRCRTPLTLVWKSVDLPYHCASDTMDPEDTRRYGWIVGDWDEERARWTIAIVDSNWLAEGGLRERAHADSRHVFATDPEKFRRELEEQPPIVQAQEQEQAESAALLERHNAMAQAFCRQPPNTQLGIMEEMQRGPQGGMFQCLYAAREYVLRHQTLDGFQW